MEPREQMQQLRTQHIGRRWETYGVVKTAASTTFESLRHVDDEKLGDLITRAHSLLRDAESLALNKAREETMTWLS